MRVRTMGLLSMLMLLLAACGGQTAAPTKPAATVASPAATVAPPAATVAPPAATVAPPAATQTPAATLDDTGTLRWSLEGVSDLTSIDPAKPGDAPTITVINNVFGGLVKLNEKLEVVPDGASSWGVSADGKTYTFTIREGLSFANGVSVTADDFVYSINRALSPATASYGAPFQLSHIVGAKDVVDGKAKTASGIKASDPRTLEITLDAPLAYFLAQLTFPYTYVVPKALVESGANWEEKAYGTGPFTVAEWKHGQSIKLVPNERYWNGKPGIAGILHTFNKDSETAYQLYQTGELDIMGSQQNP
ncbi:MAG: ABC transporter substrate-binding protein, partial [Chloroflexales bacterium]